MLLHPFSAGQIESQSPACLQYPLDGTKNRKIVFLVIEVSERVSEKRNAIETIGGKTELAGVAFVKGDIQVFRFGSFAGEPYKISGAVQAGYILVSAPRQFQTVATLTAANIQVSVVGFEARRFQEPVDFVTRVGVVLDHVAVSLQIDRPEQTPPPIRRQMSFQIGDGS
jgi:hypothetical protein